MRLCDCDQTPNLRLRVFSRNQFHAASSGTGHHGDVSGYGRLPPPALVQGQANGDSAWFGLDTAWPPVDGHLTGGRCECRVSVRGQPVLSKVQPLDDAVLQVRRSCPAIRCLAAGPPSGESKSRVSANHHLSVPHSKPTELQRVVSKSNQTKHFVICVLSLCTASFSSGQSLDTFKCFNKNSV